MSKKEKLFRLPGGTIAYLETNKVEKILRDKGLDKAGDVQQFHTANVLRRIKRYMPFVTGMTYKVTVAQTDISKPEIVTNTPYAEYLFYGKKMVDTKTGKPGFMTPEGWRTRKGSVKARTSGNLVYNRTKNPQAGPRWDKALSVAEGKAMAAELQRYINRKAGKKITTYSATVAAITKNTHPLHQGQASGSAGLPRKGIYESKAKNIRRLRLRAGSIHGIE